MGSEQVAQDAGPRNHNVGVKQGLQDRSHSWQTLASQSSVSTFPGQEPIAGWPRNFSARLPSRGPVSSISGSSLVSVATTLIFPDRQCKGIGNYKVPSLCGSKIVVIAFVQDSIAALSWPNPARKNQLGKEHSRPFRRGRSFRPAPQNALFSGKKRGTCLVSKPGAWRSGSDKPSGTDCRQTMNAALPPNRNSPAL